MQSILSDALETPAAKELIKNTTFGFMAVAGLNIAASTLFGALKGIFSLKYSNQEIEAMTQIRPKVSFLEYSGIIFWRQITRRLALGIKGAFLGFLGGIVNTFKFTLSPFKRLTASLAAPEINSKNSSAKILSTTGSNGVSTSYEEEVEHSTEKKDPQTVMANGPHFDTRQEQEVDEVTAWVNFLSR